MPPIYNSLLPHYTRYRSLFHSLYCLYNVKKTFPKKRRLFRRLCDGAIPLIVDNAKQLRTVCSLYCWVNGSSSNNGKRKRRGRWNDETSANVKQTPNSRKKREKTERKEKKKWKKKINIIDCVDFGFKLLFSLFSSSSSQFALIFRVFFSNFVAFLVRLVLWDSNTPKERFSIFFALDSFKFFGNCSKIYTQRKATCSKRKTI